jgi:hypothetical protein
MSLLANLATDSNIEDEKDSVGGGSRIVESGLYETTIAMAYLQKSKGGALGLFLTLKAGDKEIKQTLWMTSGDAKGNRNYYEDKNGDKKYLPGFNTANSLCLLSVGKEISAMDPEQKVVSLYSPEAKAEVPTKVDVLTELLGKEVIAGVLKQTVDKTVKNDAGVYVPTGETREENEIDKFFRASDRKTTAEIRAQADASFADTWEKKWTGVTRDRASKNIASGAKAGAPVATKKPTTSLFG